MIYVRKLERVLSVHRLVYQYDSAVQINFFVMFFATVTLFYILYVFLTNVYNYLYQTVITCRYLTFVTI